MLKGETGLLHANGRKQHKLPHTGLDASFQDGQMGLMIDSPGIARRTGARGHAGDDRVKWVAAKAIPRKRNRIVELGKPNRRAFSGQDVQCS